MTQKYDIDSLIEIFEKCNIVICRDEEDAELCLSKTLLEICKEIQSMQKSIDKILDHIYGVED